MTNPEVEQVLSRIGIEPAADGAVELCHATLATSARAIQQSGEMNAAADGIFFCTSPEIIGRIVDEADGVLRVRVLVDDLIIHRDPDFLASLLPDSELQAEFVCFAPGGATYRPLAILEFEPLSRDAFD